VYRIKITHRSSVSFLRSHRLRVFVRVFVAFTRWFGYAPCLLVSRAREASRDGREAVLVTEDDGRIRSDRWRFIFFFFWKKCPKVSYCSSYNDMYHFPSFPNNLGHHLGKRRRTTSLRAKTRVKPSRAETGRHFTRTNEPREHEPEQMLAVSTTRVIVAAANTQRGGTRKVAAKKPAGKVRFLDANDSNRCDARCACGNREREEDRGTAIDRARSVTFRRGCAVRYGW
jgi:hypothetical protein